MSGLYKLDKVFGYGDHMVQVRVTLLRRFAKDTTGNGLSKSNGFSIDVRDASLILEEIEDLPF